MPENASTPIGFRLVGLHVSSFKVDESKVEGDEFGFQIQIAHTYEPEDEIFNVSVMIGVVNHTTQDEYAHLRLECRYQLHQYQEWLDSSEEGSRRPGILPKGLAVTLNSIAISTSRGVLFERFRGTVLSEVIIPIIDPTQLELTEE